MWLVQKKEVDMKNLTEENVLARFQRMSWSYAGKWDGEGILGRKDSMVKGLEMWNNVI